MVYRRYKAQKNLIFLFLFSFDNLLEILIVKVFISYPIDHVTTNYPWSAVFNRDLGD